MNEPRYNCPLCLDSGLVTVWHPAIAHWFSDHYRDGLPPGRWHDDPAAIEAMSAARYKAPYQKFPAPLPTEATCVACTCRAGEGYREQKRGESMVHQVYDEHRFCLYGHGDPRELRRWVLEWSAAEWEASEWNPAESFT